jgi:hypothetical protein
MGHLRASVVRNPCHQWFDYLATCCKTSTSTSPPDPITARNSARGIVLTRVGPRPRNTPVGEQAQRRAPHLQLRPHKQWRPHLPTLLPLAHPLCSPEGEAPRPSPHPETPSSPPARRPVFHQRRRVNLRPVLRIWYDGAAAKELDRFFVGAETEREYAEMAGRRIGAAERGSRRGRSGPSATGTRKVVGGSSAWSNTRLG